ncbi:uncharacterized protein MONOS_1708 [Monocercomonoides exilis]|uniref:uncharacterized protein n=1 Tax=Monocercomonoides exilis TaxID=2049356 RepID=UPI00355A5B4E|nr:hypothetical protein MONOS_1708 [Monocercomonoides exilis]|eukprot:MONOS_1708.1-p1 / transcript=MONOS_1708.1 / gene=MONOS_1708 / organism=Monocercomonoides_exilis_PA203 / gene_product=unspecified product / transcript_product=unspecified product / location=Mono_scaffold00031:153160-153477(-) / protein_length=75 / sequence_SO=supercontig / SO=protein_coding / is_pseudo=false
MPPFSAALLSLRRLQMSGLGVSTSSSTHLFRTRAVLLCATPMATFFSSLFILLPLPFCQPQSKLNIQHSSTNLC